MLQCRNTLTGSLIVATEWYSNNWQDDLRELSSSGNLQCPWCAGKVHVRSGDVYCWHFAHHKANPECPLSHADSAEVLNARAALYQWLKGKYATKPDKGAQVSLEFCFDSQYRVDCHVEFSNSPRRHAYLIVSRKRQNYWEFFRDYGDTANLSCHLLFLTATAPDIDMIIAPNPAFNEIFLSPCHRDYLNMHCRENLQSGDDNAGELSFYDPTGNRIITFSGLRHETERYAKIYSFKKRQETPLSDMLLRPITGKLVHP